MSEQRAALINGSRVTNVIIIDPEILYAPSGGQIVVTLPDNSPVGPGWTYDGATFTAPPTRTLTVDRASIPANGTTAAVVTYRDTFPDGPASVTFTVNGVAQAVTVTNSEALLDVVSSTPGDTIEVTVGELSTTITVGGV